MASRTHSSAHGVTKVQKTQEKFIVPPIPWLCVSVRMGHFMGHWFDFSYSRCPSGSTLLFEYQSRFMECEYDKIREVLLLSHKDSWRAVRGWRVGGMSYWLHHGPLVGSVVGLGFLW